MAIGIECRGESYGLLIDKIGEVMRLADSMRENNPVNLDARLAQVSSGVIRLDSQLLVVLDIDRVLHVSGQIKAA
jgi:purine-binding chemotaxis protein CheW